MPNLLANQTSPYLLQHANNPVNWYPWGAEALEKARAENKLIVVSIGYSACHWCHVMEHESFENEEVAEIMNRNFVCIKIDREERPDLDQVYMIAVQLMTGSGGWPLNCICLPDQRPVYGGTYFRKEDWKNVLLNLASLWENRPEEAFSYAEKLTEGVRAAETPAAQVKSREFGIADLEKMYEQWKRYFDFTEGGYTRAPKFPLPNNWQFLLKYAHLKEENSAAIISRITLQKMALGGIYDHIGGGFARYSVDDHWHVPHFEKMLYDNGQLMSLYAEGYQYCKDPLYKEVVYETFGWIRREMTSPEGGFYSAIDADSEGVEGKFYTFTKKDLVEILGEGEELFSAYFNVAPFGNWEEEHTNILFRKDNEEEVAEHYGMQADRLLPKIHAAKLKVAEAREKRVRPGLDHKILAAWNGILLKGLTDAYRVFQDPEFLSLALRNASFIVTQLIGPDHSLKRSYSSSATGPAFLDDYAFVADAFIALYEVTFDQGWLQHARELTAYATVHFYEEKTGLFYYTSSAGETLIARKYELIDNVMPSSNSAMALNLRKLGQFFSDQDMIDKSANMLRAVYPQMIKHPSSYSNWAILLLWEVYGTFELAITGPEAEQKRAEVEKHYIPNKIIMGGNPGSLPLLQNKDGNMTQLYVCRNKTCQLPVEHTHDAINQILNQQKIDTP